MEHKDYVDFKALRIDKQRIIITDTKSTYTGAIASNSNLDTTIDITKTGYKPIGIVGTACTGTRGSYVNIYTCYVSSDTEATVGFKNASSSSLVANDTTITIYVAYIKE